MASINAIPCHGRALNWSWVLRSIVRYNLIFHPFRMYSRCPSFWNIFIFSSFLEYFSNFHLKWVFGTLVLHFMPISQGEGWCTTKALTPHNLQTVFWRGLVPNPVAWHICLQFFYFNYFFRSYLFIKFFNSDLLLFLIQILLSKKKNPSLLFLFFIFIFFILFLARQNV